ncbi:ATP-binding cassette sub-family A member 1-like [Arapaima gigas]
MNGGSRQSTSPDAVSPAALKSPQTQPLLSRVWQCFDLDKFEPVSDEGRLVERSRKLIEENKFWAGIVFQDVDPAASRPPPFVKYKIRMDIEEVERSNKAKDRLWAPGARDNPFNDLRYVLGGFVYLQDMLDGGIIRVHTSQAQPLGLFVQQMPYPCYVNDAAATQEEHKRSRLIKTVSLRSDFKPHYLILKKRNYENKAEEL